MAGNATAYLVGHLDTTKFPPVLKRAGVYSGNAAGVTTNVRHEFTFDVASADGGDYDEARRALLKNLRESPHLQWVRPYLSVGDRDE